MNRMAGLGKRSLPVVTLLVITCLWILSLPYSGATWTAVLSDEGSVRLAIWTPTATASPTAVSSPTPESLNCTYTLGYWKNHSDGWPVDQIAIAGATYARAEALALLDTAPRGDASYCLVHHLIAARLNVLSGADPAAIAATMEQADGWLALHPLGSAPSNPDRQAGVDLAETLDAYNSGRIGPGYCEKYASAMYVLPVCPECTPTPNASPTSEGTATQTPTGSLTPEPTATPTLTASLTPEPTATQAPATFLTPGPTGTQTPIASLTPEPTATQTPTEPPTATTEAPTPTLEPTATTEAPPPTLEPTEEATLESPATLVPTVEATQEPGPEPSATLVPQPQVPVETPTEAPTAAMAPTEPPVQEPPATPTAGADS